ncbi:MULTISPECIES: hypothetical protein [unclassified Thermoactinomyces]|jgi:replication initiation and membrane attachment protein DnaB|uniref:hypothetical protein n=1 Tax=unclassified Thermoactinomyces TaxID=2634588 RepID=UPI0018DC636D|nr:MULTISPECIES: hypothetical protein [unclassified Thermoactinomyces]MBH8597500.1 hypothetical protein [Thermoactinomyces sp. CICC 10523]MBH8603841.1 hypothetical protein [Thermoactinomyces sp. CICC 10522]MBH8608550.1 hypothetical protein [Thermoactinomyces sp. CICC 10521]
MTGSDKQLHKLETMDPLEFLGQFTGGQPVAKPLGQLVYDLKKNYAFSNGVINALFQVCLEENDYKIVRSHVMNMAERLGAAMVRTAQDVFAYLQADSRQSKTGNRQKTRNFDSFNSEYVETNIALIARQLHEVRQEVNIRFQQIQKQLDRIESQLGQLTDLFK